MRKLATNQQEIKANFGGWFRFYNDALDNPKVQKLPGELFKFWTNVLCLASKLNGKLPDPSEIAFRLRMSEHDTEVQISALIERDLIELATIDGDRIMAPKGWAVRQPRRDKSRDRMRKFRRRKNTVTPGDASRDGNVPISTSTSTSTTSFVETERSIQIREGLSTGGDTCTGAVRVKLAGGVA